MAAVPLLLTAYQTLSKALRCLKDLPLAVVGVQAMSDGTAQARARGSPRVVNAVLMEREGGGCSSDTYGCLPAPAPPFG